MGKTVSEETAKFAIVPPEDSLRAASALMTRENVKFACVVESDRIIGVIDAVSVGAASIETGDGVRLTVRDIMADRVMVMPWDTDPGLHAQNLEACNAAFALLIDDLNQVLGVAEQEAGSSERAASCSPNAAGGARIVDLSGRDRDRAVLLRPYAPSRRA